MKNRKLRITENILFITLIFFLYLSKPVTFGQGKLYPSLTVWIVQDANHNPTISNIQDDIVQMVGNINGYLNYTTLPFEKRDQIVFCLLDIKVITDSSFNFLGNVTEFSNLVGHAENKPGYHIFLCNTICLIEDPTCSNGRVPSDGIPGKCAVIQYNSINAQSSITVAHEMGHCLGLYHDSDTENIMYPGDPLRGYFSTSQQDGMYGTMLQYIISTQDGITSLTQKYENTILNGTLKINDVEVSSNTSAPCPCGEFFVATKEEKFLDIPVQGDFVKHLNWSWGDENIPFKYLLRTSFTRAPFDNLSKWKNIFAEFDKTWPASYTSVSDIGTVDEDKLIISDPWFVYGQDNSGKLLQYNPTTFVEYQPSSPRFYFLNRRPYQIDISIPYYSLRKSKILELDPSTNLWKHKSINTSLLPGDLTCISITPPIDNSVVIHNDPDPSHINNDYETKAIEFRIGSREVSTNYKAHLYTNHPSNENISLSATSPNSQRKIDWVQEQGGTIYQNSGLYQSVYCSGNEVWFIQSTDMGTTWSAEVRVSSGSGTADRPCLAADSSGAYISFIEQGEMKIIRFRNGIWDNFTPISGAFVNLDASPVIEVDGQSNTIVAVWENNTGKLSYSISLDGNQYFGVVPNVGSTPAKPTIAHQSGTFTYHLAWREGVNIFYQCILADPYTQNIVWLGKEQVNQGVLVAPTCAPSITACNWSYGGNGVNAVVAYETIVGQFERFVVVRGRQFSGFGAEQILFPQNPLPNSGDDYWAPSIAQLQVQQPFPQLTGLRIACNHKSYSIINNPHYFRLENNGSWWDDAQNSIPATLHPSAVAFPPAPYGKEIIPIPEPPLCPSCYEITSTSEGLNRAYPLERSRELLIKKDTTVTRLLLGVLKYQIGNEETKLGWHRGFDTSIVGVNASVEEEFRTQSFTVQSGMHLKYTLKDARRGMHELPHGLYLRLQLVKSSNNQVLTTFGQFHPRSLSQGRRTSNLSHSLHQFLGEEVYFRFNLVGIDSTVQLGVVDYYTLPGQSLPKFGDEAESEIELTPSMYTLDQNHPNPFGRATFGNAATEISYSIPEEGTVQLLVLDLLGREVATLVNEYKPIGTHTVTFNGEHLPSGVYYYRLVANGQALTRKMTLMK